MYFDTLTKLFSYSYNICQMMHQIFSQYMTLLDMKTRDSRLWLSTVCYMALGSCRQLCFSRSLNEGDMHSCKFFSDTIFPLCSEPSHFKASWPAQKVMELERGWDISSLLTYRGFIKAVEPNVLCRQGMQLMLSVLAF